MSTTSTGTRWLTLAVVFVYSFSAGVLLVGFLHRGGEPLRIVIVPIRDLVPGEEFDGEFQFRLAWRQPSTLSENHQYADSLDEVKGPWESSVPIAAGTPIERRLLHSQIARPLNWSAVGRGCAGTVAFDVDVPLAECGWLEAGDWVCLEGRQTLAHINFSGIRVLNVQYHCSGWHGSRDRPQLRLSLLIAEEIEPAVQSLYDHQRLRVSREPTESQRLRAFQRRSLAFLQPLWALRGQSE